MDDREIAGIASNWVGKLYPTYMSDLRVASAQAEIWRRALNFLGGITEYGWVQASSLRVLATDLEGNDLAFRSAGIETLASFAVVRGQDAVPEDLWLTDHERLDAAIESALGPGGSWLRHRGTPE